MTRQTLPGPMGPTDAVVIWFLIVAVGVELFLAALLIYVVIAS